MGGTSAQLPVGCQMSLSGHRPMATQFNCMAQAAHTPIVSSKVESAIDYLTEYRTALITSAATGKIDVRKVKIPQIAA